LAKKESEAKRARLVKFEIEVFFGFEEKESKNECGELELVELVVLTMNVRGL